MNVVKKQLFPPSPPCYSDNLSCQFTCQSFSYCLLHRQLRPSPFTEYSDQNEKSSLSNVSLCFWLATVEHTFYLELQQFTDVLWNRWVCQLALLRPPWLRVFRAFSSVVRQMPGFNPQRWGTARTLQFLCCSVYCLCVNVYCTTATGWLLNCS
jgi:hypothetical protein